MPYRGAAVPLGLPRRAVIHGTWRLASLRALAAILSSGIPTDAVPSRKWLKIAGGVISGLCNEPDLAVRRRWRLHHGEG